MFVQVPNDTNPYWQEWALWHWLCETDWKPEYAQARASIGRLVRHHFEGKHPNIVGGMITMFDCMVYDLGEE